MGRHSQAGAYPSAVHDRYSEEGPRSAAAQAILDQFERAKAECAANPPALVAWLPILRSYGPGLLSQCLTAQAAAEETVAQGLKEHMFKKLPTEEAAARSAEVAAWFNDHKTHRSHERPLRYAHIHGRGVEVHLLEDLKTMTSKMQS